MKIMVEREELNNAAKATYDRVAEPALEALRRANMTSSDLDQIELIGGGVRIPMVLEKLEEALERKDLGVHLNGDEAMCFGSAFIASNSSSSFKVKSVLLTQHPDYDVHLKISPTKPEDAVSEEDQKAEGLEDTDIIKYNQEIRLFDHAKDYMGKSKGLSMNYNKDMTLEFFKVSHNEEGEEELELLDKFHLEDIAKQYENEMNHQVAEYKSTKDKAKRKAKEEADKKKKEEKKKAKEEGKETEEKEEEKEEEKKEEEPEEEYKATTPKLKVSVEFSRSGYLAITKAQVVSKAEKKDFSYNHSYNVEVKQERKST